MSGSAASGPYRVWLGLGGNMGDPVAAMGKALKALDARTDTRVVAVSPVYRTPPWGKTDQAWFHNACAEIETALAPLELLGTCLETERALKRVRVERWGPRTIDMDILAMEDGTGRAVVLSSPSLQLPHPRMKERPFVLVPLNDIAPSLQIDGRTVADLHAAIAPGEIEKARTDAGWWRG